MPKILRIILEETTYWAPNQTPDRYYIQVKRHPTDKECNKIKQINMKTYGGNAISWWDMCDEVCDYLKKINLLIDEKTTFNDYIIKI